MKLRPEEEADLNFILAPIKNDDRVQNMRNYIQHGRISTYDHVESVTRLSYWINKRFHLGGDEKVLTIGAFLHDYYLYDWHDHGDHLHGLHHPAIAVKNAQKDFQISEKEALIIASHMWPLTPLNIPRSREALMVCLADKICAIQETLFRK